MATKKSNIVVKPGDDISWAGTISRTGIESFAGYSLKAQFRAKGNCSSTPQSLLATSTITWVDVTAGTFLLKVPRATTEKWPTDITVLLDIQVVDPNDKRVRTESIEFKTEKGVTELGGSGDSDSCDCAEWVDVLDSSYLFQIQGENQGVTLDGSSIVIDPSTEYAGASIEIGPNVVVRLGISGTFHEEVSLEISTSNSVAQINAGYPFETVTIVLGSDGLLTLSHEESPGVSILLDIEVLQITPAE